eukprot:768893-Amorphochlora_amoeboformis.AAC.1
MACVRIDQVRIHLIVLNPVALAAYPGWVGLDFVEGVWREEAGERGIESVDGERGKERREIQYRGLVFFTSLFRLRRVQMLL